LIAGKGLEEKLHLVLYLLGIGNQVSTLLVVHPRDAVEEVPLQAQCNRCTGLENLAACSLYIDFLYGLAGYPPRTRSITDSSDEPDLR
jgi:hypothetical protein